MRSTLQLLRDPKIHLAVVTWIVIGALGVYLANVLS